MTSLARARASLLSLFIITCLNCFAIPGAAARQEHAELAATAQTQIVGPAGSGKFGQEVMVLPNGNILVTDPYFDDGAKADVGAVYLYNGATLALISRLKGSTPGDRVGISAQKGVTVLTNGNFVVASPGWSNGAASYAGAVTWCSATTGCRGTVSASNSLVGKANDRVGSGGVTALTNGNYVVKSSSWNNPTGQMTSAGAATWGKGTGGTVGLVTSANSLVGRRASDLVGFNVTALTNGNYVVSSPFWDNPTGPISDVGAATWGDGAVGRVGLVTSSNSLVGGREEDHVGIDRVTALTNGNYVVSSGVWDNPAGPITDVGAATWCNGTSGRVGLVRSSNSLTGGLADDKVGFGGAIALANGNYVVSSLIWDNPAGPISDVGAATWCDGASGRVGLVTSSNSLIGGRAYDYVGNGGVTALTNGNYVVSSFQWDNPAGPISDVGAATLCNGTSGRVGVVTAANSLIGGRMDDRVGEGNAIALTNGNYVVSSPFWDNPTGPIADVGAATWCNGTSGRVGLVTPSNSLVGGTAGDRVGHNGVTALTNGNYVVSSQSWNNPAGPILNVGAATWCNGRSGRVGLVRASNSLIGRWSDDSVSSGSVDDSAVRSGTIALTNGNYLVDCARCRNPSGSIYEAEAVAYGNGGSGTTGLISSANSVFGAEQNGISSFSHDAKRNRLFVGRKVSNIVTIRALP